MNKEELKKEIMRYVDFGYSVQDACSQVNNLYLNKYLSKIYEIKIELERK